MDKVLLCGTHRWLLVTYQMFIVLLESNGWKLGSVGFIAAAERADHDYQGFFESFLSCFIISTISNVQFSFNCLLNDKLQEGKSERKEKCQSEERICAKSFSAFL
jgi:hypothetical protein